MMKLCRLKDNQTNQTKAKDGLMDNRAKESRMQPEEASVILIGQGMHQAP